MSIQYLIMATWVTKLWLQRHLALTNCSWNNYPCYLLFHAGGKAIWRIRAYTLKKFIAKTMSNLITFLVWSNIISILQLWYFL